jgi:tRNA/rRNA methyltransferase
MAMQIVHSTRFVLLQTLQNENVGAAARALKTMGFSSLSLVNPHDHKVLRRDKVKQRASGATDVLTNAQIYSSLEGAVEGCDVVCGTGMPIDMYRTRKARVYVEPRKYFETFCQGATLSPRNEPDGNQHIGQQDEELNTTQQLNVAFLFGSETTGMSEEDMDKCHVMLGIPTNPTFGSLNLASAVQIIAYDWRMALGGRESYH